MRKLRQSMTNGQGLLTQSVMTEGAAVLVVHTGIGIMDPILAGIIGIVTPILTNCERITLT